MPGEFRDTAVLAGAQRHQAPEMSERDSQPPPVRLGSSYSKHLGEPRTVAAPAVLHDGHFTASLGALSLLSFEEPK